MFELLSQTRNADTQTPSQVIGGDYAADALSVMLEETNHARTGSHSSDDSPFSSSRDDDEEEEQSSISVSPSFIPGESVLPGELVSLLLLGML